MDLRVRWTSSNASVASVDSNGTNVSGIVDVIVNVDNQATTVLRVDALLSGEKGDTTVASYSPSNQTTQTSAGPTTLTFNTLGIINGAHVLRVRVALRNGTEVVSSSIQLTIKNP